MNKKPKILFWINGFFLHFCLAYYLQSHLNADFFGIIDINSKPKKFFQNQNFVNFQKIWFFHDQIKKNQVDPDLNYLLHFEQNYHINLWKSAINERFFYKHNRFYKFKKQEILSILEQELKFFESVLDEIKPDYFLTYDPPFHHQKLLLELCKAKDIRVLSVCGTGIENKIILTENGATFDLDSKSIDTHSSKIDEISKIQKTSYDLVVQKYLQNREIGFFNKFKALKDYLFDFDSELENSNFMYYGKTKFKVIKDAINLELKRRNNFHFLQKTTTLSPDLSIPYVYFPMNVDEEMNILHYAPYYTNQIEVIRHIAKSIPIDYVLYVKEHIASKLRGWMDPDYYKEIIEIPNVVFINPLFDNNALLKNSKLLVAIRGTTPLKAIKNGKASVIFGDQPFQILPSVFKVDSLDSLPILIKKALNHKVNPSDYEKYEGLLKNRSLEFDMFAYEYQRDSNFFSGRTLSNVLISDDVMNNFLKENENLFSDLVNGHLKIISS
ncbi:Hypothetical protein Nlim_2042 [Candidatus Nitrosarchaeum limnium SFB1]|jgi:hypothetical protein|uniref:Capsule polysaccharide biosynthesis protein n=1 Tax=Candidatus Nitrosarchaeum limnium SFB1 TaxID=886738 RepID=F3KMZ8_9ARCH|nr:Hypothetical protein Nlim_2042 [Candidatus Nitrosarchaeum limnium SFB1]